LAKNNEFEKLKGIMRALRAPDGCPWDKKQTHKSLLPYVIEEAYEVIDSVNKKNDNELKEELGDLLLQVVFHAQIAKDRGKFDIDDVIKGINHKLISRHPHVFGDKKGINTGKQVKDFWEAQKKKTKKRKSVLEGVPKGMPVLLRSRRLISKAVTTGFKWKDAAGVFRKVEEEAREVKKEIVSKNKKLLAEELGDLMFVTAALAYYSGINPEEALHRANDKFIKRFGKIEGKLHKKITEKEMLKLWNTTKKRKNNGK